MHKVILSYSNPKFIYGTTTSYPLAILQGDPSCQDWIYSHYINLHVGDIKGAYINPDIYFDTNVLQVTNGDSWGGIPLLDYGKVYKKELKWTKETLPEAIYELLKQNKYIFTYVNVKGFSAEQDRLHNILVHGIDLDREKVYLLGFKEGVYGSYPVDLNHFSDMFFSEFEDNMEKKLVTISRNNIEYVFDLKEMKVFIADYLSSTLSMDYFDCYFCESEREARSTGESYHNFVKNAYLKGGFSFGIKTQEILRLYINYYISKIKNGTEEWFDIRSFRCFLEHKLLMFERFKYIQEKRYFDFDMGNIVKRAEERAEKAEQIFNTLLKIQISGSFAPEKLLFLGNEIDIIAGDEAKDLEFIVSAI